jgi:hypothetical protein
VEGLWKGRHKLTRISLPHGDGQWLLYDLQQDPAETRDLSDQLPELRAELLEAYAEYADRVGVVELPEAFDITAQLNSNVRNRLLADNRCLVFLLTGSAWAVLFLFVYLLQRRRRSR